MAPVHIRGRFAFLGITEETLLDRKNIKHFSDIFITFSILLSATIRHW
jgi:hypothetical protein